MYQPMKVECLQHIFILGILKELQDTIVKSVNETKLTMPLSLGAPSSSSANLFIRSARSPYWVNSSMAEFKLQLTNSRLAANLAFAPKAACLSPFPFFSFFFFGGPPTEHRQRLADLSCFVNRVRDCNLAGFLYIPLEYFAK